jgi:hypothetical protein
MDKFEYKILDVSKAHLKKENFQEELMETLNNLGFQGVGIDHSRGFK